MNNFTFISKNKHKRGIMKKIIVCLILILSSAILFFPKEQINVYAENQLSSLDAKSYILVDYNTKKVLANHNEQEHLEVASMVKLMTSLITIEKIEKGELALDQKVVISEHAASQEGSQAFLDANKEYTVEELLKSVIIASANDSSVALAECIASSEEGFVNMMNERANELGLSNTHYANASGLPSEEEQYSCAEDIAKLLSEEIKHELYFKYSNIWIDEIIHESGRRTELVNTNILIRQYKGCDIGKTGFTDEAGYCLSASSKKNNMRLVSVVIGAKTTKERFSITTTLLNYGFNNFENKQIISKDENITKTLEVKSGNAKEINLAFETDFYSLEKRGETSDIKLKFDYETLEAPIKEKQIVGKVYIVKDGEVLGEVNIISKQSVEKSTFKDIFHKIIENYSIAN